VPPILAVMQRFSLIVSVTPTGGLAP
jgi:hypothetical protein